MTSNLMITKRFKPEQGVTVQHYRTRTSTGGIIRGTRIALPCGCNYDFMAVMGKREAVSQAANLVLAGKLVHQQGCAL